ncbi:hypothetical protein [Psychroserpens luteolus]|uniref:hypothetical protein n=1 Tax=Psychroserpens luteolus TaxID=2855840 RepID=UPI001E568F7D|nr:hypothetical protein [Psychroserpens luteolus]MCD2260197.1 hypothetical protein [Psychroserpens luteolus]
MSKIIDDHFDGLDLDIRKKNIGTFMDQKVTPDVVSGVAECILEYLRVNDEPFTINDIRYFDYSNQLVKEVFNKPDVQKAENEYDKFFAQPIKMFAYAGILEEDLTKRPYKYCVSNNVVLDFVGMRERNAVTFLQKYLEKIISDSGIKILFEEFFTSQNSAGYERLKTRFIDFVIKNTPKNDPVDISRIFTKIINPLAYKEKKFGTRRGRISQTVISLDELYYNRPNWRDINKDKSLTREEAKALFEDVVDNKNFFRYQVTKAKNFVRKHQPYSEIHRFEQYPGLQAHHIFMESEFPQIADLPENIIILTPNQHYYRAHPNNKTSVIDEKYQAICLISKLDSIEINNRSGENDYSLEDFINVLNTGFETDHFNTGMDYEEVKHQIINYTYARA